MHEATVTIIRKNKPGPGKKMWELVAETGEKFKAFDSEASLFDEGKRYRLNFEPKEFNGFPFKAIKGTPKLLEAMSESVAPPLSASDVGPHGGMWEREVFGALLNGKTSSEIRLLAIEARQLAREILKTNLDGKLLPASAEFNDDLENTY